MKTKRIYKRALAEFLVDNGCHLIRMVPDISDPTKKNWLFEDTPELRERMTIYSESLRK